jgi:molybdopterin-containing oxidoreductase family iron-sulfur binding subunit
MVIDVDRCTGCQACVVACQSENNIPINDEGLFNQQRANQWIRIERYWEGEYPDVKARFIPVLCQHCDDAPCEPVCPVYATYHNAEGLNVQVYNRCIGTRFCANNCPYTVRVFNWFDAEFPAPLDSQLNPDVSVRPGGVMEKCTFCVQRIQAGKDEAAQEERDVADGDIRTACQQSCPTKAIAFGDLEDPDSEVSKWAESPRAFSLLGDLDTRPGVVYLSGSEWREPAE